MSQDNLPDLLLERKFQAPLALVWQAWTAPEQLRQWWGPKGFKGIACKMELRAGGEFDLSLQGPDGVIYPCRGTYLDVSPLKRIVYDGEAGDGHPCGAGLPPRALVTISFEALTDTQTQVTIHTHFESVARKIAANENGYSVGWSQSLERLEQYLLHPLDAQ